jgi:hypothetical protein
MVACINIDPPGARRPPTGTVLIGAFQQKTAGTSSRTPQDAGGRVLDVCFVSTAPGERHARVGGHPVPMALVSWMPAFAGMTRSHKHWQCIYVMDI